MSSPDSELSHARRSVALVVTVLLFFSVRQALPLDSGILEALNLKAESVRTGAAILAVAALLWLTEALPLAATSLLIPLLAAATGSLAVEPALAAFADPVIFLFLGGFILAGTLHEHGLDTWMARGILFLSGGRFLPAAIMLILATAFISMWISNTATAAMMLPLALGVTRSLAGSPDERRRGEVFLLLGIGFAASVGGVGALVGTPPNGIAARQLGLDFNGWFRFGLPVLALWLPAMIAVLLILLRPSWKWRIPSSGAPSSWTGSQRLAASIFGLTVLSWLFSSQLGAFLGVSKGFDTVVALCSIALIFATGCLSWKQAERQVEWGVLLLFGGGLCLGRILEVSGCSAYLARWFTLGTEGWPYPLLVLALAFTITVLSEFASNTAVATLMVPLFAKVAVDMGLPPEQLVIPVALAASCGFMLPVATPPNALIYGTGRVPQRLMLRAGGLLDLACILLLTLFCVLVF